MTALIVIVSVLTYLVSAAAAARYWYGHIRPWTEPLACTSESLHSSYGHTKWCYRRWGMVDTKAEALRCAFAFGLLGPFASVAILIGVTAPIIARLVITSGSRELPEEVAAANKRLERELGIGDQP